VLKNTAWRRAVACAFTMSCAALFAPVALAATPASAALDTAATAIAVGAKGPAVVILQDTLNDWGVPSPVDGSFTPVTASAVAQAAADIGGSADNLMTQLALIGFGPRAPQLQLDSRGPEVATLQRALTRAGDGVGATGVFGPQTDAEVKTFQRAHGLAADGIITLWQVEDRLVGAAVATVASPAPLPADIRTRIADMASALRGRAYAWGGIGPWSFDCSGLVAYVYREATGMVLPHSSYLQWLWGRSVAPGTLQPGDLVFFDTDGWGPSHVGIYIGGVDQDFVDATNPAGGVQINTLYDAYWAAHYVGARDILS